MTETFEVVEGIATIADNLHPGDPADLATEMEPIASDAHRDRILGMIADAVFRMENGTKASDTGQSTESRFGHGTSTEPPVWSAARR